MSDRYFCPQAVLKPRKARVRTFTFWKDSTSHLGGCVRNNKRSGLCSFFQLKVKISFCFRWEETYEYLNIIAKWWTIVNILSPDAAHRFNNILSSPFFSADDDRLNWLDDFALWMSNWSSHCHDNGGPGEHGYSKMTFTAVHKTTTGKG